MKAISLIALALVLSAPAFAKATRKTHTKDNGDPCNDAAYAYAVKSQHKEYKGKDWKKDAPGNPDVEQGEVKKNGFEIWTVEFSVDEECLEGYSLLMRRSANGKSCAAIKEESDNNKDCG